ncbi:hypothetical protein HAX54_014152, partial [Datura stramonium]|nr:hypothetical protein [Datura stramonium]
MFVEHLVILNYASTLLERILKALLQIKKEEYGDTIDSAETSIKDLDANDFSGALNFAGAIEGAPFTCEESFTEPPVRKSPITSKGDDLVKFLD